VDEVEVSQWEDEIIGTGNPKRDAKQIKPITEAPPHVEVIKRKRANKSDENSE